MNLKAYGAGAALAAFSLVSSPALAASYLYTYTGNDLTDVTSACCGKPDTPFTTSDFIRFQFRSPDLLGPDLVDAGFAAPITSWSLSLGPLSYSSADGVLYSINFSTNAASQIIAYQFTTQTDVVAPNLIPAEYPPTPYEEEVFSFDFPALGEVEDGVYIPSIFQDSAYAANVDDAGTWTITAVPEPATWAIMLVGLGGLGAVMRGRGRERLIAA